MVLTRTQYRREVRAEIERGRRCALRLSEFRELIHLLESKMPTHALSSFMMLCLMLENMCWKFTEVDCDILLPPLRRRLADVLDAIYAHTQATYWQFTELDCERLREYHERLTDLLDAAHTARIQEGDDFVFAGVAADLQ